MSYIQQGTTIYQAHMNASSNDCPFEEDTCTNLDALTDQIESAGIDDLFALLIALGVVGFLIGCGKAVAKAIYE